MKKVLLALALVAFASGCWTFCESPYPQVVVSPASAAGTNAVCSVAVVGFEALLTEYVTIDGYRSVYIPGHYGRHHYHPGYFETVPAQTYLSQLRPTETFLRRAKDMFEENGYMIGAATPDWTVEVHFSGPTVSTSDYSFRALWMVCTAFFCDYAANTWSAKLKVRDNRTGRLVFSKAYEQRYEVNAFGLVPIFGIASCDKTSSAAMQGWCLAALTDRVVADASAVLSGVARSGR